MVDLVSFHDQVLDAAVARWYFCRNPNSLLLRGSYVTRIWIGKENRVCNDLDFLAIGKRELMPELANDFLKAMECDLGDNLSFQTDEATTEIIFAETPFPGLRISVPAKSGCQQSALQIDIGFGDPLADAPVKRRFRYCGKEISILTPTLEVAFGWKLHGLIEFEGGHFHPKSLLDLWLLIQHGRLTNERLANAIEISFTSRDTPFWRLHRLVNGKMGGSAASKKAWRKVCKENSKESTNRFRPPTELNEVVRTVGNCIGPIIQPLRKPFSVYPKAINLQEMHSVVSQKDGYEQFDWFGAGKVFAYRNIDKTLTPNIFDAPTNHEFRRKQLTREARGITFDQNGTVISRPYPMFDSIRKVRKEDIVGATILEKLDGSLVFPTPIPTSSKSSQWIWRTRRGHSEIAANAGRHAEEHVGRYEELTEHCLSEGLTPLFEWCSPSHVIVLEHEHDKLILTGVRQNESGSLWGYKEILELSARFQIPVVRNLGQVQQGEDWEEIVNGLDDCEGVVLVLLDGRLVKVKSKHYRLLHQAVEGPESTYACWQLILNGRKSELLAVGRRRKQDFSKLVQEIESKFELAFDSALEQAGKFSGDRKMLAANLGRLPGIQKNLIFSIFDKDPETQKDRFFNQLKVACDRFSKFQELQNWVEQIKGTKQ